MKKKLPACGDPNCSVSSGICSRLTFGSGELSSYGYWENPCYVCARDYERRQLADTNGHCEAVWPPMTGDDFIKLCEEATELNELIATSAMNLLNDSEEKLKAVIGISILSREGHLGYSNINESDECKRMILKMDEIVENNDWGFTRFPEDFKKIKEMT